jgi:hypothetical protein
VKVADHATVDGATHHGECTEKRGADVVHGTPLILRLGLERESREGDSPAAPRRGSRRRGRDTSAADLVEPERPAYPGQRANLVAQGSPGASSTSMTMNASPPRSFRVRRRFAMLISCSARIGRDGGDRSPFTSSAMSTMV